MTVCLDTNVFLQMFGRRQPFRPILEALLDGRLSLALSTEILMEYEEVTVGLAGAGRWQDIVRLLETLVQLHGDIHHLEPQYRFHVITGDLDDNKFCDCAIAADADFIVTDDAHFAVLTGAGYKPRPISPREFILHQLTPK